MPKEELPIFLKKRKLLWETKDKNQLAKYGDLYLNADFIDDALDFYERAQSHEGFLKIEEISKKTGNLVLYKKVAKILRKDVDPLAANEIGMKAMEMEKFAIALDAFKLSKNEVMQKKIEELLTIKD